MHVVKEARRRASELSASELARYIDHSVLKPEFAQEEIAREVANAVGYGCRTVCVNPSSARLAASLVKGSQTGVCVVADFPFGTSPGENKLAQVTAILDGPVDELDIVAAYGLLRSADPAGAVSELGPVVAACHSAGVPVKVILETDALTFEQVTSGVEVCAEVGADFVKTSTGFYTGERMHGDRYGAFPEMIEHLITTARGRCQVKGSAGIRDRAHFLRLIDLGVDRMGIGYRSTPLMLGLEPAVASGSESY